MQPQSKGEAQVLYCINLVRKGVTVLAPGHLDWRAKGRSPGIVLGKSSWGALVTSKAHTPESKSYMVKICKAGACQTPGCIIWSER